MKPSFEVKLLLKPEQVLGDNKEMKQEVLEHFQAGIKNMKEVDTSE